MLNIFYLFNNITLDEKTKKAILVLCAIFIIVLLIFGGIYALIHAYMKKEASKMDGYMYDLIKYKIITKPSQFKNCVNYYEERSLYNNSKWGFILLALFTGLAFLVVLIFFDKDYKGFFLEGFKIFPKLSWTTLKDIKEAGISAVGFDWMPVSLIPNFDFTALKEANKPLFFTSCIYYITVLFNIIVITRAILGYLARKDRCQKKANEVFLKDLDKFDIGTIEK